ncbi:short chain dehydrogenase yanD [Colletotrichum spaethianum]|uniref:Short chain dehydrogenase yanD n=1 Tax=Colletotrichum spaethianum TaxID=700344 RepID=A0AA37L7I1_9PEZI|nr:short chain dehydrogenase yanD [Colletotrichum spaethianum]GKT43288.1 short chain dehydrogenase yanD [Colletotrichum spaethianum]
MGTKQETTAEPQASVPRFFYQQITVKPAEIQNVNLQGKTAIITGANTGVGYEAASQLLGLGLSKLVLAVRNLDKGKAAAAKLSASHKVAEGAIEVWELDLSVYESIVKFVERTKTLERIDFIVLNAGVAHAKRVFNEKTGHDEMVQVNFISTALLAILLLPVVQAKRESQPHPTRITFTSSEVAGWTAFAERKDFPLLAALDKEGKVDMLDRMFVSKLLGQFFIHRLAAIVPPSIALINSTSPGSVHDSEFNREHDKTFSGAAAKVFMKRVANSAAVGSRFVTDAIVNHGEETHGLFLSFTKLYKLAPIIYTPEGEKIEEQLWSELMAEFAPFKAEEIIKSVTEK